MCETCSGPWHKGLCIKFCLPIVRNGNSTCGRLNCTHHLHCKVHSILNIGFIWTFYYLSHSGIGFPFREIVLPGPPEHQFTSLVGFFLFLFFPSPTSPVSFSLFGGNQTISNKLKQTTVGFGPFFLQQTCMPSTFEKHTCSAEVLVTDLFSCQQDLLWYCELLVVYLDLNYQLAVDYTGKD